MQNFTEMNFYDGTLNLNISLQQAHTNMAAMLAEVKVFFLKSFNFLEKNRFFHLLQIFHLFEKNRLRQKQTRLAACATPTSLLGLFPTSGMALVIKPLNWISQ